MPRRAITVQVNPEVLRWARESAGIDLAGIAKRLNTKQETVEAWEKGTKQPTLATLERLAVVLRRPLAAFFLPSPPVEAPIPTDFRTLPAEQALPLSAKTRIAIRRAQRLQSLAAELLGEMGEAVEPIVGSATIGDDAEDLATVVRKELGVSTRKQADWRDSTEAFRAWRAVLEMRGVMVFQSSMPLEETRGLSLAEKSPPAIVINTQDAPNAKNFTLFHEYAHLLLHKGGLCLWREAQGAEGLPTERFCNHFAGAILLPKEALLSEDRIRRLRRPDEISDLDLDETAKKYKVSKQVVWRRMQIAGLISFTAYRGRMGQWEKDAKQLPKRKSFGRSSPARRCVESRGPRFAGIVLEAKSRDIITYKDVADFLSVRLRHLGRVESLLAGSKVP